LRSLQAGATPGKLQAIKTYEGTVRHVKEICHGSKADAKKLVRALAFAKGLSRPVNKAHIQEFFYKN